MFLGAFFLVFGIGALCWLIFNLAVYALPFFAGVTAGMWAYETGAGPIGAIIVGFVAGGLTLGVFQGLLIVVRPVWARLLLGVLFAAPAAVAGYYTTLGLAEMMMPSEIWRMVFAVVGAIAVGVTAWIRVFAFGALEPRPHTP
jgi:hypothetical protein